MQHTFYNILSLSYLILALAETLSEIREPPICH